MSEKVNKMLANHLYKNNKVQKVSFVNLFFVHQLFLFYETFYVRIFIVLCLKRLFYFEMHYINTHIYIVYIIFRHIKWHCVIFLLIKF